MSKTRVVKLKSSNGDIFDVEESVLSKSKCLVNMIEDVGLESPIPLLNVASDSLVEVIDYCKYCTRDQTIFDRFLDALSEIEYNEWSNAKLKKVDMDSLYDLIMAAHYMHIETLLHFIEYIIVFMIAQKTLEEMQQIVTFGNNLSIKEDGLMEEENQSLASFLESLPEELQHNIKVKLGQRFHHGGWSPWRYDEDTQTLFVELANLYDAYDMHHQIAVILFYIDIGLVSTLVLQTCRTISLSAHQSRGPKIEWIEQMDMDLFKTLQDDIAMRKIKNVIVDEETIN